MDKRWRNLGLLILIIVIVIGYFYFYTSSIPNPAQNGSVTAFFSGAYASAGVSVLDLNDSLSSFSLTIDDSKLNSLSNTFKGAAGNSNVVIKEYSSNLLKLIELEKKQTALENDVSAAIQNQTFVEFCPNMDSWDQKISDSSDLVGGMIEEKNKLDSLYAVHPELASVAVNYDVNSIAEEQIQIRDGISRLIDMCIAAVYSMEDENWLSGDGVTE